MGMKQLIIGAVLFVLGILIVRGCIRDYRDNLRNALADDLWDYLCGHTLAIVAGAVLMIFGAGMILMASNSDWSVGFSANFPFVRITHSPTPQP
jgi:hypothetical protein